ncbi:MAG: response regulator [Eubacteriales bacterium]|nr:response regulator [Eubacteriales bacterium]
MKILIVDDEIRLGRLIQKLIPWEELGFTDMGCCTDSVVAFHRIQEEKPNIVITDIRMPKMTGLELIEKVREFDSEVFFIIISGYSDFSYAQSAVRFGVEDYILKPIQQTELVETLKKVDAKYKKKLDEDTERETLKMEVVSGRMNERCRFFERLLLEPESIEMGESLEELNDKYSLNFQEKAFRVLVVNFLYYEGNDKEKMMGFLFEKLELLLEDIMLSVRDAIIYRGNHQFAILINGDEEAMSVLPRAARKIRSELMVYQEFLEDARVYLYLTDIMEDCSELLNLRETLERIGIQRFNKSNFSILQGTGSISVKDELPEKFYEDFVYFLETMNQTQLLAQKEELLQFLGENNDRSGKLTAKIYLNIRNQFIGLLKSMGYEHTEKTEKNMDSIYDNSNEAEVLFRHIFNTISTVYERVINQRKMQVQKPVNQAKEYIDHHYGETLSLDIVGSVIGLNPAYLSSLFKKETGMSFADYIVTVRIKEAQKLLLQTEDSLSDIAEKVGYNDPKYFSKTFKKEVGMKPSDYRKLLS